MALNVLKIQILSNTFASLQLQRKMKFGKNYLTENESIR